MAYQAAPLLEVFVFAAPAREVSRVEVAADTPVTVVAALVAVVAAAVLLAADVLLVETGVVQRVLNQL